MEETLPQYFNITQYIQIYNKMSWIKVKYIWTNLYLYLLDFA